MVLSIIIPVYNVEKYLRNCLDSIINQTIKDVEIIIVNDGSTDGSSVICQEFLECDERIKLIEKENAGLCAARNDGINAAKGKWIAFVDSDDWCDNDYFERMIESLPTDDIDIHMAGGCYRNSETTETVWVTHSNVFFTDNETDIKREMKRTLAYTYGVTRKNNMYSTGSPWDKIYRTEFLKKNKLFFDESSRAWEDLEFNFFAFDIATKVSCSNVIGYHYRQVSNSITKGYNPNKKERSDRYCRLILDYISTKFPNDESFKKCYRFRALTVMTDLMRCYLFNDNNHSTWKQKRDELTRITQETHYYEAIGNASNEYYTIRQIIVRVLLKYRIYLPIYFYYKLKKI